MDRMANDLKIGFSSLEGASFIRISLNLDENYLQR